MKNSATCPKCGGNRILHVTQVADSVGEIGDQLAGPKPRGPVEQGSKAWRIARVPVPEEQRRWWKGLMNVVGLVEAFVCRACGYTELYTVEAAEIEADGELIRELEGPEPSGPYR